MPEENSVCFPSSDSFLHKYVIISHWSQILFFLIKSYTISAICHFYRNSDRKTLRILLPFAFANRNYWNIYTVSWLLTNTEWRIQIKIPTRNADGFSYFHWFSILIWLLLWKYQKCNYETHFKRRLWLHCAFIQLSHG